MRLCFKITRPIDFPETTIQFLRSYCQSPTSCETGGVLAGFLRKDNIWVVSHPMPPSPRNRAGRFWVKRHRGDSQKFVENVFKATDGIVNYIGEWHTHPEPVPTPSGKDRKMIDDLLRTSRLEINFLIGVIVGTSGTLCVWCQDAGGWTESSIIPC
jgi:integrative and conjugative element protein (TIGR02256 family)